MIVREINTKNKGEVRQFIRFPSRIYAECEKWIPPLEMDMMRMLDRDRHPFYLESDAAFFMASCDDGEPLGRIAVLDNKRYNRYNDAQIAFFYLFDVIDDFKVANLLFKRADAWAKQRGLKTLLGPKGFSALNGLGMLVKGFDQRPALGVPYNHPYYPVFMERMGFELSRDILSGYMDRSYILPEKISLIAERVREKRGLIVQRFTDRRGLRKMLPYLRDLYNGSLVGTSGNAPLTNDEVQEMADQILWFANPRLIKVLMKEEKPVGFLLAYPDISDALKRTGGRLWPFGWAQILRELKRTKWININGAGILEEYRGMGGTAVLFDEMAKSVLETDYEYADLVQVGVENERMQRELSSFGINFYKAHRIYQREIKQS
jgi:hypothetical protein